MFWIHVDARGIDGCLTYEKISEETQGESLNPYQDYSTLGKAAYASIVEKVRETVN
jgi:hypothetical protein